MDFDDLIVRLGERYADDQAGIERVRHRSSALDVYIGEMQQYTLRRLNAEIPGEFTLSRLTSVINRKSARPFCLTAVRKALIAHGLYQLWR
jgi:hypothetical protein